MKKILVFLGISMAMVVFLSLTFRTSHVSGAVSPLPGNPELPDSVLKIVQKACMDCHSDDGNGFAKGKVNFSKWSTYELKKQADKAYDINKVMTKGTMPKPGWAKANPDGVPTPKDIEVIKNWAAALNK